MELAPTLRTTTLEKGQFVPSTLLAFRIARELGMRVDGLFELNEEPPEGGAPLGR